MEKGNWIESEREYEFSEGLWVAKKKKEVRVSGISQKTKDTWDIIFKFFAATAIFTPFLILSLQNRNEYKRQKKTEFSQLYFDILYDLKKIKENGLEDSTTRPLFEKIAFIYPTKLAVYNVASLNKLYDTLKYDLAVALYAERLIEDFSKIAALNEEFINSADLIYSDSSYSIRRKTFLKDSARIKSLIYDLDNAINQGSDDCNYVIKYSVHNDSLLFNQRFLDDFTVSKTYLMELQRFSDNLWDSLLNRSIPLQKDIIVSSPAYTKRNPDLRRRSNEFKKYADSVYRNRKEQLQALFLEELK